MKLILPILTALAFVAGLGNPATAQQEETLTNLGNDWKRTNDKSTPYLLRVVGVSDTCWQYDFYSFNGPLIRTEQFRDRKGKLLHGTARYYNAEGNLDSIGSYQKGKKHGEFYKLGPGENRQIYMVKYVYDNDQLVETEDLLNNKDSTINAEEKDSRYPGGISRWQRYLQKNLKYPKRAIDSKTMGSVIVLFAIEADGHTSDPFIFQSREYSLDMESIRIIRESGKWKPALQDGKKVKSFQMQPIIYKLE